MHAKFQLIWMVRLVRVMGVVKIDSSSYNWRKPVVHDRCLASLAWMNLKKNTAHLNLSLLRFAGFALSPPLRINFRHLS